MYLQAVFLVTAVNSLYSYVLQRFTNGISLLVDFFLKISCSNLKVYFSELCLVTGLSPSRDPVSIIAERSSGN